MGGPLTETPFPTFPNEIYGMFIELLREDPYSFRACSLVSPVFRRFCTPILCRNLSLNYPVYADDFIRIGERSNVLQHTKSFRFTSCFWTEPNKDRSHKILDIISRKASLETLHIRRAQFHSTYPESSVLHKLSTVTVLILEKCHFGGFGAFTHFIGCFRLCESLQLYGSTHRWVTEWCEQEETVGAFGLGHMKIKSFAYAVDDSSSMDMLKEIAACGLPEEIHVSFPEYRNYDNLGFTQLAPFTARIKSLILRCDTRTLAWWISSNDTVLPPSPTLERIRIIVPGILPSTEGSEVLDATFSNTDRYPSLEEFEVCTHAVTRDGKREREVYERVCMDRYLPRLAAIGRLLA